MVESLIKYTQSAAVNPTLTLIFSGVYRGLENKLSVQNKVYLHFLKVREGELAILEFENDLKYNNLIEL